MTARLISAFTDERMNTPTKKPGITAGLFRGLSFPAAAYFFLLPPAKLKMFSAC